MSDTLDRGPGVLASDRYPIRALTKNDLRAIVTIDQAASGRRRTEYFTRMLERALEGGDVRVSLVAEQDARVVGFVVATVFYGEFGIAEPAATIDTIAVAPECRRQHVGEALMRQLRINLGALGVTALRSEVPWDDFELLAFFRRQGFAPAQRVCLERALDPTAPER
ncbi:MAG: GNAT family N-acetyltransferase [Acidobacteriota bacterium]|nr:GNAT family N-acetyltransferase [Acidobacteriota bacterium]